VIAMTKHLSAIALVTIAACSSGKSDGKEAPAGGAAPPAAAPAPADSEGEAAPFVAAPRSALVGKPVPPVHFEMLDGTRVELVSLIGQKPIYLKFWATWCVPCREQMPHMDRTWRAHEDELAVFAVDLGIADPIEDVRAYVAKEKLGLPVAIDRDGSAAEQLQVNVTPQHIVVDRAGIVRHVGHALTPELERAIAAVIAEPAPAAAPVAARAAPAPDAEPAPLALDDGTTLALGNRKPAPLALTFAKLSCDTYIAKSQPATGAACAAHARAVEVQRKAHPELTWVTIAHPVWTDAADIGGYRQRLGATTPIGVDRGASWFRRFQVRDVYTTVLVDASGAELGRTGGDGAELAALVAKAR
jgi:thiol-disulfide isomerase/thioredoxin